ncbi:hypothetical protein [Prochlorothrix hollandica]|uniref:Uncharacterized protein n=1 Tax=Prochlorothrix hollandica PCC 9006 = CALU 1027 TaxID=317619 RepID=A0A0M2PUC6_PROHO|nr:hypothetical protein [Prochlorothrix hollandica]KKI98712.1 hypothetical protein PROH_17880 [Prochlorothrix hollandica PCC 9006 = CALU 1027]
MSPLISQLLPSIAALSDTDKLKLVQLVLAQLLQEDKIEETEAQQCTPPFNPRDFFGVTHQPKQVIDDFLAKA